MCLDWLIPSLFGVGPLILFSKSVLYWLEVCLTLIRARSNGQPYGSVPPISGLNLLAAMDPVSVVKAAAGVDKPSFYDKLG